MAPDGAAPAPGRPLRVVAAMVAVVALAAATVWWFRPARRIDRRLDALRFPPAVRLVGGDGVDEGWICADGCSWESRRYDSALPPERTLEAVAAAFRARGYDVDVRRCADPCTERSAAMERVVWDLAVTDGATSGFVFVGPRGPGAGVEVLLVADG